MQTGSNSPTCLVTFIDPRSPEHIQTLKGKTEHFSFVHLTQICPRCSSLCQPSKQDFPSDLQATTPRLPVVVEPGSIAGDDDVVGLLGHIVLACVYQPVGFSLALLLVLLQRETVSQRGRPEGSVHSAARSAVQQWLVD